MSTKGSRNGCCRWVSSVIGEGKSLAKNIEHVKSVYKSAARKIREVQYWGSGS